jgi:hypothetical protein
MSIEFNKRQRKLLSGDFGPFEALISLTESAPEARKNGRILGSWLATRFCARAELQSPSAKEAADPPQLRGASGARDPGRVLGLAAGATLNLKGPGSVGVAD